MSSRKWPWFWRGRTLCLWAVVLVFSGIAPFFVSDISPPWLGGAVIGTSLLAGICLLFWLRLLLIRHHGFQIVEQVSLINVHVHKGTAMADITVEENCVYQSLTDGQKSLRVRRYVRQPSSKKAEALLAEWGYKVNYRTDSDDAHTSRATKPRARLNAVQTLDLEFTLPKALKEGERVTMSDHFEFNSPLSDKTLLFPVFLPTAQHRLIVSFKELLPRQVKVELIDGTNAPQSRLVPVTMSGPGRGRAVFTQSLPRVGEEILVSWTWDKDTLTEISGPEAPKTGTPDPADGEYTEEEGRRTLAERLFQSTLAGDAVTDAEAVVSAIDDYAHHKDRDNDHQSAEDHPLIKSARARLGLLKKDSASEKKKA